MKLNEKIFERDAAEIAPELLGKLICRETSGKVIKVRITEVEVYNASLHNHKESNLANDPYCHSVDNSGNVKKPTPKKQAQFGKSGIMYIHHQRSHGYAFDITTGKEKDKPQSVLVRSAMFENKTIGLGSKPNICILNVLEINVDKNSNNRAFEDFYIEDDGFEVDKKQIKTKPRVLGKNIKDDYYYSVPWNFSLQN